jgi:hypothetical protein
LAHVIEELFLHRRNYNDISTLTLVSDHSLTFPALVGGYAPDSASACGQVDAFRA